MTAPARILVVEDDAGLRVDLVDYLNLRGFLALGASSVKQLWEQVGRHGVDLVLLDIGLPDESGLDQIPLLRQRHPGLGIIMLSAFGDPVTRVESLDRGADVYLIKDVSLSVIEASCTALWRRLNPSRRNGADRLDTGSPSSPDKASVAQAGPAPGTGAWSLDRASCCLFAPSGAAACVTLTEMAFLQCLMAAPGVTIARTDILAALSRPATLNNLRNLDGLAARLRRKVEQDLGETLPVKSFYGQGYVFMGQVLAQNGRVHAQAR